VTRGVWERDVFRSDGTWLFKPDQGSLERVLLGGWQVAWAEFDGALYVLDRVEWNSNGDRVVRFDPRTGKVEHTGFKGIYFSPSGAYYFRPLLDAGGPADIFETSTSRSLRAEWPELARLVPQFVGWAPEEDLALCVSRFDETTGAKRSARTVLINPDKREVSSIGDASFVGSDGEKLVLYRSDRVLKKAVSDLQAAGRTEP
jgi:hypothetical protein